MHPEHPRQPETEEEKLIVLLKKDGLTAENQALLAALTVEKEKEFPDPMDLLKWRAYFYFAAGLIEDSKAAFDDAAYRARQYGKHDLSWEIIDNRNILLGLPEED